MSDRDASADAGQKAPGTATAGFASPSSPSSSSIGPTLTRLREQRGWSQEYVSERLKFSMRQIRALEAEHWDLLPQGMSLRGFVRNYARFLETDPEPLLQELAPRLQVADPVSLEQASSLSSPLVRTSGRAWPRPAGRRPAPWLIGAIMLIAALALLGYALNQQGKLSLGGASSKSTTHELPVDLSPSQPEEPLAAPQSEPLPSDQGVPGAEVAPSVLPTPVPGSSQAPALAAPAENVPPPEKSAGLSLNIRQASWVEVRRADGSLAVSRVIAANEPYELEASGAPLRVVIGNVNGVELSWRGASVDLSSYRRDNVARLTLQ